MSNEIPFEIIEEVQEADRDSARLAIKGGVQSAQEKWIEAHLIAEALALEMINIVGTKQESNQVAALLRKRASRIEKKAVLH